MKGLLLKDWYTLIKQMKIMLVLMLVFACVPGYSMAAFAVVYAAMLPVTALAYDERSKWDELAAMLPYSVREIVGGKYVLGVTAVAAAGAVAAAAQLIPTLRPGRGYGCSDGYTVSQRRTWRSSRAEPR